MTDTLLAIGGGAAAISAILALCNFMMKTILRAYTRDADIALAQRETQRAADDAAQTKRIEANEASIVDLDHRVDAMKADSEASVNRIVRLETSFQSMETLLNRMDGKLDALSRR